MPREGGRLVSELPATVTRFTDAELLAALRAAYRSQLGHPGAKSTICVLAAQVALETNGGAACIQWNLGNFKAGSGDCCRFRTTEYVDGAPVSMVCSFAVYTSLEDGAESYIRDLYSRWTLAWSAAVAGDPLGFAKGLHDQKPYAYYTAPVAAYAAGMERWFRGYMAAPWADDDEAAHPLPAPVMAEPDVD